jgi:hypothetical protein
MTGQTAPRQDTPRASTTAREDVSSRGNEPTAHAAPAQTPRASTQTRPRVSAARRRATLRLDALESEWLLRHALRRWLDAVEACRRANGADCARNPRRMASWVQGQVAHLAAGVRP